MSRLDTHVTQVQNKLALGRFFQGTAWCALGVAVLALIAVLLDRLFRVTLPQPWWWVGGGVVVALVGGMVWASYRRPASHDAAVAIDIKLGLKEKFSTALFVRASDDPFAKAAVRDAERTAEKVSLRKQFPLTYPTRVAGATIGVVIGSLLCLGMIKQPLDLFGTEKKKHQQAVEQQQAEQSKRIIESAVAQVQSAQAALTTNEELRKIEGDLRNVLKQPPRDPNLAQRTALKALQDADEAIKQSIAKNQKYADAKEAARILASMKPLDNTGPVGRAQQKMAEGKFSEAVADMEQLLNEWSRMDKEEQEKAIQQMQQMAQQLAAMANDPDQRQRLEDKMKQLGADDQQAQELAAAIQEAAQGDQQAMQQVQNMQQNLMQQMNNGQGPTAAQQQQMQQLMQQVQAQANAQAQAQQMSQNAQQMAQAMQQAQQAQQGQQPGQQQNPQGAQQMVQAQQAMQQALQQLQAINNDAQQVQAAQQAMQQACQNCQGSGQGQQPGQQQGNGPGQGAQMAGGQPGNGGQNGQPGQQMAQGQQAAGQWGGNPQQPGNPQQGNPQVGQGLGAGQAAGDRPMAEFAPAGFTPEHSPSQDQENGKILASTFVKAEAIKGESKAQLKELLSQDARQPDQTDEIDQQRISRQDQEVVKKYFEAIQSDLAR
jgi:hypothetical protein